MRRENKKSATCHPDKPRVAKGLCNACYQQQYAQEHPNAGREAWQRKKLTPEKELLKAARRRARQRNRPFGISLTDIKITKRCPILGTPLVVAVGHATEQSPSLDEITVGKGYVPDNIQVISRKANTMKSNATPEELRCFARWVVKTYGA